MNQTYDFVASLTNEERRDILSTFEEFERTGMTGDTAIRLFTERLMKHLSVYNESHIAMWMSVLAMNCYKFYYKQQSNT